MGTEFTKSKIIQGRIKYILDKNKQNAMEMQKKELVSLTERNQKVPQRCWEFYWASEEWGGF